MEWVRGSVEDTSKEAESAKLNHHRASTEGVRQFSCEKESIILLLLLLLILLLILIMLILLLLLLLLIIQILIILIGCPQPRLPVSSFTPSLNHSELPEALLIDPLLYFSTLLGSGGFVISR